MAMHVPARPQMAQELRALGGAPSRPDARDRGAHRVHHPLPGHALRLGLLRLAAQQPHQRKRRGMRLGIVEGRPASASPVRERQIAAPRKRLHLPRMAEARELQRDVDHGETGAEQHHRRVALQAVERVIGPGIGHEERRVVEPGVFRRGRARRQIAGREHDDVGLDLAPVGEEDAARREVEQPDRLAAHDVESVPVIARERLLHALLQIGAEQFARHEGGRQIAAALVERLARHAAAREQPLAEARHEAELHAADGNVEQMLRLARAVGEAAADATAALDHHHARGGIDLRIFHREDAAAEAAADHGDDTRGGRMRGSTHPVREIAFQARNTCHISIISAALLPQEVPCTAINDAFSPYPTTCDRKERTRARFRDSLFSRRRNAGHGSCDVSRNPCGRKGACPSQLPPARALRGAGSGTNTAIPP